MRKFRCEAQDNDSFTLLHFVTVSHGAVYVSGWGNPLISIFSLSGQFMRNVGARGVDNEPIAHPAGIAIANGILFIAEHTAHRISVFDVNGTFMFSWGDNLCLPTGIAIWDNMFFLAEQGNHRISVFQLDGTFVRTFASKGQGDGQLNKPHGITVSNGLVFVSDWENRRISVFHIDALVKLLNLHFFFQTQQFLLFDWSGVSPEHVQIMHMDPQLMRLEATNPPQRGVVNVQS